MYHVTSNENEITRKENKKKSAIFPTLVKINLVIFEKTRNREQSHLVLVLIRIWSAEMSPDVLHHAARAALHNTADEATVRANLLGNMGVDKGDGRVDHVLVPWVHLMVLVKGNIELSNDAPDLVHAEKHLEANNPTDVVVRAGQGLQLEFMVMLILRIVDEGLNATKGLRLLHSQAFRAQVLEILVFKREGIVKGFVKTIDVRGHFGLAGLT